jgi:2-keto-4-pentenoate hydratase/2-oxohepta-3-ene-1,7-dioic acid hydratase in catechol pathway
VKRTPKVDPPVWLKPGDTIEVECPAIGVLCNQVVDEA